MGLPRTRGNPLVSSLVLCLRYGMAQGKKSSHTGPVLQIDTDGPDGSSPVDQRAVDENEAGGLS
ncbi:hypothetical protein Tco_1199856, partial [Tanacetum coccineum]